MVVAAIAANGTTARSDRVATTGPASTTPAAASTKVDGFENPSATGAIAAMAHRNRTRPGVRTHSTARPISPTANRKSVA
jgi:hypothetical protein